MLGGVKQTGLRLFLVREPMAEVEIFQGKKCGVIKKNHFWVTVLSVWKIW
jgi:hypothetical protein